MKPPTVYTLLVAFDSQLDPKHADIIVDNFVDEFKEHDLVTHIEARRVTFEEESA